MESELQRASLWKRIAAGILDLILVAILATGFGWGMSALLHYDSYYDTLNNTYARYETQYGVNFQISEEEYTRYTDEQRKVYDEAYQALITDEEAVSAYNMTVGLSLTIVTVALLLSSLVVYFVVPLVLKNGQTIGKKCFSLCLVRNDGVKLNAVQLFTRALLGQFAVETMIPVYVLFMIFWNTLDIFAVILVAALALTQLISFCATRSHSLLHDLMAGTVVVDFASQRIFRTTQDLIEYKKRIAAERAARQSY